MRLLITALLLTVLASCADNPLDLSAGQWVKHKIDGQKYYVTKVILTGNNDQRTLGVITVKNEFGEVVDKRFPIHEFVLWYDTEEATPVASDDFAIKELSQRLHAARKCLDLNLTPENQAILLGLVEEGEEALSLIFGDRKWNPVTSTYE